jgi:hypothetical protein
VADGDASNPHIKIHSDFDAEHLGKGFLDL